MITNRFSIGAAVMSNMISPSATPPACCEVNERRQLFFEYNGMFIMIPISGLADNIYCYVLFVRDVFAKIILCLDPSPERISDHPLTFDIKMLMLTYLTLPSLLADFLVACLMH